MKQILPEISKTTDIDNYVKQTMPALRNILNNYQVKYNISYGDNFFPSKTYKGIKYPAGYYNSLVITLGQGLGENFWCVMYPPLCLIDENKNTTEVEYKSYVKDVLLKYIDKTIRIPMRPVLRSLNLSNSVCIIAYEILRQINFEGLQEESQYFS